MHAVTFTVSNIIYIDGSEYYSLYMTFFWFIFHSFQNLEDIIERDFYPDMPELKAQTEYIEAVEKNDLIKLREIQMRAKQLNTGAHSICKYLFG